ncbi:MAG: cytochrome c, partial [Deltaproteobacteria bacterium]|nr:cytochrome c [Deltaproteobacteria bacterium]
MKARLFFLSLILFPGLGLQPALGQDDLFQKGKAIYEAEGNCVDCHRLNGKGLPGTYPAHDGNPFVVGEPNPVIATVLNGRKGQLGEMPSWKDKLDDTQVAAVVTYIRHAWSNKAPGVT